MARVDEDGFNNFCSVHDGSIASFERLGLVLTNISKYEALFDKEAINYAKYEKFAGLAIHSATKFVPVFVAPQVILAGLGSASYLYKAGTGKIKDGFSAKGLAMASLSMIGGGALSSGISVLSAAGTALGSIKGGAISNAYFGELDHFDITEIKRGDEHGVIFVNGFLSEKDTDTVVWKDQVSKRFQDRSWYHLDWEAHSLKKLGIHLSKSDGAAALAINLAKTAADVAVNAVSFRLEQIIRNPWHTSMVKAQMAGVMLADAIARTPNFKFTLVGHSLGARVIYFALEALSTKERSVIQDVYLLGGAVGGGEKDSDGWKRVERTIYGRIHNCFSKQDSVLENLYSNANFRFSTPIGFSGITHRSEKIINHDFTDLVAGHMLWRQNFGSIYERIHHDAA